MNATSSSTRRARDADRVELETESLAVFGQATYSVTDAFRVTGGIRYTSDNKQQNSYAETRPFVGFVPPGPPNFIPIILTIPTTATTDIDFNEVTWKAGLEYDVGPRSLLYAAVATGFKSGILYVAEGRNWSIRRGSPPIRSVRRTGSSPTPCKSISAFTGLS